MLSTRDYAIAIFAALITTIVLIVVLRVWL